jgi:hypothetical protein
MSPALRQTLMVMAGTTLTEEGAAKKGPISPPLARAGA